MDIFTTIVLRISLYNPNNIPEHVISAYCTYVNPCNPHNTVGWAVTTEVESIGLGDGLNVGTEKEELMAPPSTVHTKCEHWVNIAICS